MAVRHAAAATASVLLSLFVLLSGATAASASNRTEPYPPGPIVVQGVLSEQEVPTGTVVVMSGDGFVPGAVLQVSVNGDPLKQLRADAQGAFSTDLRVLEIGAHSIAVTGNDPVGRVRIVQDPLTILAASTLPDTRTPVSDGRTLTALLGGLAVVVLGAGGLLVLRSRGHRAPRPH